MSSCNSGNERLFGRQKPGCAGSGGHTGGTDVSGNSEDFAETEGGAEGEGDINAPETSAQEAAETEQTEEYGGELPIGDRVKVKGIYVTGNMAGTSNMDNLISLVDRAEHHGDRY